MISTIQEFFGSIPFFSTVWFGIIAMLIVGSSWCLIGLVMGDAPKKGIEPSLVQLFGYSFSTLVSVTIMFATSAVPKCEWRITILTCGAYAVAGGMNFFMLQIMSYAMQRGPNGIIWAIIQSALIFPVIGGAIFFGVQLTPIRIAGIALLLGALALFSMTKNNSNDKGGWKIPAFICLAICAIQQNIQTAPSYFQEARPVISIVRSLSVASGGLICALLYNLVRLNQERREQFKRNLRNPILWKYIAVLQLFGLIFAYTLFYPGINALADSGIGGMAYPLMVGSCIISFTLTSILVLKEKLSKFQLGALIVCVSGLICLCFPK